MEQEVIQYLSIVVKRRLKWLVLAALLLVPATAVAVRAMTPRYEAEATIYANLDSPLSGAGGSALAALGGLGGAEREAFITSQEVLVRSYPVYQKVQAKLAPVAPSAGAATESFFARAIWTAEALLFGDGYVAERKAWRNAEFLTFVQNISLRKNKVDDSSFTVTYSASTSDQALRTTQLLVEGLIEFNVELKADRARRVAEFLRQRVEQAEAEFERSGETFAAFSKQSGFSDNKDLVALRFKEHEDLELAVSQAGIEAVKAQLIEKSLLSLQSSLSAKLAMAKVDTSQVRADTIMSEIEAYERGALALQDGAGGEVRSALRQHITKLESELKKVAAAGGDVVSPAALAPALAGVERDLKLQHALVEAAKQRETSLAARLAQRSAALRRLPDLQAKAASLALKSQEKLKVLEGLRQSLLIAETQAEAGISELFSIDQPLLVQNSIFASKLKLFCLIYAFGFALFLLAVAARDVLGGTVFVRRQLAEISPLHLGSLPRVATRAKVNLGATLKRSEALQRIVFSLTKRLRSGREACHVIVFSSATAGAGKSVSALGLGLGLAKRGAKVCLVDCDFRAVSRNLASYAAGCGSLVSPVADLAELAAQAPGAESAEVPQIARAVPTSMSQEDAGAFLHASLPGLLERLATRYQYIILDGPPLPFTEALALVSLASAVVLSVPEGRVSRRAVEESLGSIELFKQADATIFTLLTDARLRENAGGLSYRNYRQDSAA